MEKYHRGRPTREEQRAHEVPLPVKQVEVKGIPKSTWFSCSKCHNTYYVEYPGSVSRDIVKTVLNEMYPQKEGKCTHPKNFTTIDLNREDIIKHI